ncbi:MAG TPA: glycosyltransferase family 9 protein [Candidatus Eisenbacteria bacterium]|nr:glycosyltransferase family 9 protein [Candidatus Eisenbacteria bacterium]
MKGENERAADAGANEEPKFVIADQAIDKILLVRPSFRMGNSILATPFVFRFRNQFPSARIDFVGGPISAMLFENLPIDHHYQITRRFPEASWAYLSLIKQIRSTKYDLAVELSGSQSAMGAWITGWSGARHRIGLEGKRGRYYDLALPKPATRNKYEIAAALARSMQLGGTQNLPKLVLTTNEKEEGLRRLESLIGNGKAADAGVFLGARARKGKRWPLESFLEVIKELRASHVNVVAFAGPEEKELIDYVHWALNGKVPIVYEKSVRRFAAMVSACRVFVTCDSGPMHLACALRVRTVAIFQKNNVEHWAPPPSLAKVVLSDVSPKGVTRTTLLEVWRAEMTEASRGVQQ